MRPLFPSSSPSSQPGSLDWITAGEDTSSIRGDSTTGWVKVGDRQRTQSLQWVCAGVRVSRAEVWRGCRKKRYNKLSHKMISSLFLDPAFLEFHHELNLRSSNEKPFSMTDVSERGTFLWRSFSKSSLDFIFFPLFVSQFKLFSAFLWVNNCAGKLSVRTSKGPEWRYKLIQYFIIYFSVVTCLSLPRDNKERCLQVRWCSGASLSTQCSSSTQWTSMKAQTFIQV